MGSNSEFHQHPDGLVYVRTANGIYGDTRENFVIDYGESLPSLPEGADDHVYTQGKRHAFMGDGNVIDGGPMPWEWGDKVIASIASLLAKKSVRDAARLAAAKAAEAALNKA